MQKYTRWGRAMKPREFWISEWIDSQPDGFLSGKVGCETSYDVEVFDPAAIKPFGDVIHVIEYSAYEQVQKDKASNDADYFKLRAQLAEAESVIKKTAEQVTWVDEKNQAVILTYGFHIESAQNYLAKWRSKP